MRYSIILAASAFLTFGLYATAASANYGYEYYGMSMDGPQSGVVRTESGYAVLGLPPPFPEAPNNYRNKEYIIGNVAYVRAKSQEASYRRNDRAEDWTGAPSPKDHMYDRQGSQWKNHHHDKYDHRD